MPKRQKKIYLTDPAAFYLARLAEHSGKNHGEAIEDLITNAAKTRGISAEESTKTSVQSILDVAPDGPVLTAKQVARINLWCHENNNDKTEFLKRHALRLAQNGWRDPDNQVLNNLSADTLGKALFYGYQPAETPIVQTKAQKEEVIAEIHADLRRELNVYLAGEDLSWHDELTIIRMLASDLGETLGGMKAVIELT